MRILVVDDNVDAALTLHDYLASLGHESVVAHDGPAALDAATTFRPSVAVLDPRTAGDGWIRLARKLREQHVAERLVLIAVTGYGQDVDRARSRDAGFDHHLVKPVALDRLATLLEA